MAVYDYATTFTQLLQQKYAKELCSDALTQSRKQPETSQQNTGLKQHTRI